MSKVLVVDDSEDSAKLLAFDLEDSGFDVVLAFSGDEGIALAATEKPDIILLDMRMPGLSGLETLKQLKTFPETHDIPVIMVSANTADNSIVEALDLGANDYITKPVVYPILAARMRAALRLKFANDQLELANVKLRQLATTDALTHLYNRRHFFSLAHAEFSKSVRHNRPLSFIILDVDKFKSINDTFGHAAGDKALCVLAECCQDAIRESDIVGRIGGEEFAICCPDSNLEGAHRIAERIRLYCESRSVNYCGQEFAFTVSLGITGRNMQDKGFDCLFNRADHLLYEAKRSGRNRTVAC